jgi:hypothetical protein
MPPQQHNRLLDLVDDPLGFGTHRLDPAIIPCSTPQMYRLRT